MRQAIEHRPSNPVGEDLGLQGLVNQHPAFWVQLVRPRSGQRDQVQRIAAVAEVAKLTQGASVQAAHDLSGLGHLQLESGDLSSPQVHEIDDGAVRRLHLWMQKPGLEVESPAQGWTHQWLPPLFAHTSLGLLFCPSSRRPVMGSPLLRTPVLNTLLPSLCIRDPITTDGRQLSRHQTHVFYGGEGSKTTGGRHQTPIVF